MLSMKIFYQIRFVWQKKNDLGFSSDFKKNSLTKDNNIKTAPFPTHTHTTLTKFDMIRVQYLDHGKGHTDLL